MPISELPVMFDAFATHKWLIVLAVITAAFIITLFVAMAHLPGNAVLLLIVASAAAGTVTMVQSQAVCDELRADVINEWLHDSYGLDQTISDDDIRSIGGSDTRLTILEDGQALELITINGDKLALVDSGGREVPQVEDQK